MAQIPELASHAVAAAGSLKERLSRERKREGELEQAGCVIVDVGYVSQERDEERERERVGLRNRAP